MPTDEETTAANLRSAHQRGIELVQDVANVRTRIHFRSAEYGDGSIDAGQPRVEGGGNGPGVLRVALFRLGTLRTDDDRAEANGQGSGV
jgi:hypothetical protein